jgi:hypothetical protein
MKIFEVKVRIRAPPSTLDLSVPPFIEPCIVLYDQVRDAAFPVAVGRAVHPPWRTVTAHVYPILGDHIIRPYLTSLAAHFVAIVGACGMGGQKDAGCDDRAQYRNETISMFWKPHRCPLPLLVIFANEIIKSRLVTKVVGLARGWPQFVPLSRPLLAHWRFLRRFLLHQFSDPLGSNRRTQARGRLS